MNNPPTYEDCLLYMKGEEAKTTKRRNCHKTSEGKARYHYAVRYIEDYEKALRTITLATDILNSPKYQEMWEKHSDTSIQHAIQIIGDNS